MSKPEPKFEVGDLVGWRHSPDQLRRPYTVRQRVYRKTYFMDTEQFEWSYRLLGFKYFIREHDLAIISSIQRVKEDELYNKENK